MWIVQRCLTGTCPEVLLQGSNESTVLYSQRLPDDEDALTRIFPNGIFLGCLLSVEHMPKLQNV
jgi:hypothetical protein